MINFGFTKNQYPSGTHMCLIYNDELERKKLISKYLDSGLLNKERVLYFADTIKTDEVIDWLMQLGLNIPDTGNQFTITVAEKTYCPKEEFIPDLMLDNLRKLYNETIEAGYDGVRVSGEMTWALKEIPGSDRLMEYEALVNEVVITHPVTAICQYDANLFDGATILDVLNVHPMMIVRGQIVHNPYYMKPEDFLSDYRKRL